MGAVVLDSSVILGVFDPTDAHHRVAFDVVRRHTQNGVLFALPAVVMAEVLVREARRSHAAAEKWRESLTTIFGAVRPVDEEVTVQAAYLRAKHTSLRLPDALVLATAVVDNADVILTVDKRWAELDPRVQVLG